MCMLAEASSSTQEAPKQKPPTNTLEDSETTHRKAQTETSNAWTREGPETNLETRGKPETNPAALEPRTD